MTTIRSFLIMTAQVGHYHDARYRALVTSGLSFKVLVTQNEADFPELMSTNSKPYAVHYLYPSRLDYTNAMTSGTIWKDMFELLFRLDPMVIAVAGWSTPECFAAIAWARRNKRRVVVFSESQEHDASRNRIREYLKKRVVSLCDAALVGGISHANYISKLGINPDRTFLGYDAVDNVYFSETAAVVRKNEFSSRLSLGMPSRYLLASARFIPKKNIPYLVAAYGEALRRRTEGPDLVILGDGPERSNIEAAISLAGLEDRVHLVGFRGYDDLPAIYALSEGFIHVSTSEQWGLVINEAAASGLPIVASTACGAAEILLKNGINGFLVNALDIRSIASGIGRLMDLDELNRNAMGIASQGIVDNWGVDRFCTGLISAHGAALGSPGRRMSFFDFSLLRLLARFSIKKVP